MQPEKQDITTQQFPYRDLVDRMRYQLDDGENFVLAPEEIPFAIQAIESFAAPPVLAFPVADQLDWHGGENV